MKNYFVTMMIVSLWAINAEATIRTVSQYGTAQFTTIQTAINAAATGDTVLVSPGTYSETLTISSKILALIGAGWDLVTVDGGASSGLTFGSNTIGSTAEGFDFMSTARAYNATQLTTDSITVRRCRLRGAGTYAVDLGSGRRHIFEDCVITSSSNSNLFTVPTATAGNLVVRNCILGFTGGTQTTTTYFTGNNGSVVEVTNCTFVSLRQAFNLTGAQPVVAMNNVYYDWTGTPTWGTYLVGSVFDYNASDASAPAIPGAFTNHILLGANNPFVTYDAGLNYVHGTSDLHLNGGAGGLALTNTGHPLILNTNGSRSDVGAYGGPRPLIDNGIPAYPFVTALSVPNLLESGDDLNVSSTGRVGPRY